MRFNGIDFNTDWVQSMTEQEFVDHPLNRGHWKQPGFVIADKARKDRLRELHRLLSKKEGANANDKQSAASNRKG